MGTVLASAHSHTDTHINKNKVSVNTRKFNINKPKKLGEWILNTKNSQIRKYSEMTTDGNMAACLQDAVKAVPRGNV